MAKEYAYYVTVKFDGKEIAEIPYSDGEAAHAEYLRQCRLQADFCSSLGFSATVTYKDSKNIHNNLYFSCGTTKGM